MQFLEEVKKLSGVGQRLLPADIDRKLQMLVKEQNVSKTTVWQTPYLKQFGVAELLNTLGVELVSPNADKHAMAMCNLGVTEADYLLSETETLVLHSSFEKPRGVSLLPRIHRAILHPDMLRGDMHNVFAEAKAKRYLVLLTRY